jgi:ABC-type sugar transport system ATPase subunit
MTAIRIENVTRRFGETVAVDAVNLEMPDGKLSFLLGPSGCGKTTLLRMIAGFIEVTSGRILFDGVDVSRIPANRREVGMVFQSYALWPHLTVAQNVAFGLEVRKLAKAKVDEGVARALSLVRMERYAARKPTELSGGQQQRVALARAIVYRPKVLLLDEPLSNLDAKLRHEMRNEIRRICDESRITTVYVTHDQEEAMSLSDRMAIFMDGRIVQIGTPEDVFAKPATASVATFLGNPPMNVVPARIEDGYASFGGGSLPVPAFAGLRRDVSLGIRPSDVTIDPTGIPATVTLCEVLGEEILVDFDVAGLQLRGRSPGRRRLAEGERVGLRIDAARLHVFDRETGLRIEC